MREKKVLPLVKQQKNAITVTGIPISLNAVVVACGFLALVFSNFVPLINFGWLLSATMLICSISTLTIIPTILFLFSGREIINVYEKGP